MRVFSRVKLLFAGLVLGAIAVGGVWMDYRAFLQRPVNPEGERYVVIEPGMGGAEVITALADEEIVNAPIYLRFYLWRSDVGGRLQPGTYRVEAGTSVVDMLESLTKGGDDKHVLLYVPEGTNLYELAALLQERGIADSHAFLRRATDARYAAELGVPAATLEGYLLPGRYTFEHGVTVDAIIAELHARFRGVWVRLAREHGDAIARAKKTYEMGDHELVTLASMVEKEAVVGREKPVIARVFFNRLGSGMRLQSDPTCVYPPLTPGEKPTPGRCRDASNLYSTYAHDGIPPGPIGAPGESSLEAVLEPYKGPGAGGITYFVARNDGSWTHYFSATYAEHEQAIAHFLKKTRKRPPNKTRQP